MIAVSAVMGVVIIATICNVGKQLYEDIKADIKRWWLFDVSKLSFKHNKFDSEKVWEQIDEYLKNGVRVTPMKIYMDNYHCDLKTAKAVIDKRYIKVNNIITVLFNCRKCSKWDDVKHIRVRDVTLKEHGINKPYKGVYKCTQCNNEVILDNEEAV